MMPHQCLASAESDAWAHAQVHNFALPKSAEAERPQAKAADEGDSAEAAEQVTPSICIAWRFQCFTESLRLSKVDVGCCTGCPGNYTATLSHSCIVDVQAEGSMQQMGIQGRMQEAAQLRVRITAVKVLAASSFLGTLLCGYSVLVHDASSERGHFCNATDGGRGGCAGALQRRL